jgi:hypothetical protein
MERAKAAYDSYNPVQPGNVGPGDSRLPNPSEDFALEEVGMPDSKVTVLERGVMFRGKPYCSVPTLSRARARWKILYETPAPTRFSRDLLMRAVAYRMQERMLGGLKSATRPGSNFAFANHLMLVRV